MKLYIIYFTFCYIAWWVQAKLVWVSIAPTWIIGLAAQHTHAIWECMTCIASSIYYYHQDKVFLALEYVQSEELNSLL